MNIENLYLCKELFLNYTMHLFVKLLLYYLAYRLLLLLLLLLMLLLLFIITPSTIKIGFTNHHHELNSYSKKTIGQNIMKNVSYKNKNVVRL